MNNQFGQLYKWIRSSGVLWIVATPLVLIWAIWNVEITDLHGVLKGVSWPWLMVILLLFMGNFWMEVAWTAMLTPRVERVPTMTTIVGWQMLASSLLPGRAGDLVWIFLLRNRLRIPILRAAFLASFHRLQDLAVVLALFSVALLLSEHPVFGHEIKILSSGLLIICLIALLRTYWMLTVLGRLVVVLVDVFDARSTRWLAHQILKLRRWYRVGVRPGQVLLSAIVSIVRWLFIVAALIAAIMMMLTGLGDAGPIIMGYILVGSMPLHTIGGYGLGEISLASLLQTVGYPVAVAAAVALVLRTLINLGNLVCAGLAGVVWLGCKLFRRTNTGPTSEAP